MKRQSKSVTAQVNVVEPLENRSLLSGGTALAAFTHEASTGIVVPAVSHHTVYATVTRLTLSTTTAVMGAPITMTARVTAVNGPVPTGQTVNFANNGVLLGTATVSSRGYATLVVDNVFQGSQTLSAYLVASKNYNTSISRVAVNITVPTTTSLGSGLRYATVVPGSGTGAVTSNQLTVNYTGYLLNGTEFDTSLQSGRSAFSFTLGAGQVISGWEKGLVGLKAGETRVLYIPSTLGYGSTAQGTIPANSELVFIVTGVSIA